MSDPAHDPILAELRGIRDDIRALHGRIDAVHIRLDSLNTRLDTVIDALTDLRRDFDQHTHE